MQVNIVRRPTIIKDTKDRRASRHRQLQKSTLTRPSCILLGDKIVIGSVWEGNHSYYNYFHSLIF